MQYGIQMYSVRDLTEKDLALALQKVSEIGYKSVEFAGYFGHSAEEVKAMLEQFGLTVSGTHSGLDDLEKDFANPLRWACGSSISRKPWIFRNMEEWILFCPLRTINWCATLPMIRCILFVCAPAVMWWPRLPKREEWLPMA